MLSKEILQRLYVEEKLSLAKIAKLHGVSTPTISNWMASYGISKRSISQALIGQKHSAERNKRKADRQTGRTGRKASEHTRQLISIAKSGKNNHMYGKKHSAETKEKMSNAATGREMSQEAREKMSEAKKNAFAGDPKNHPRYGLERTDMQGENNPNWNGGISSIYRKIRRLSKYKMWRTACFERDNYTCLFCFKRGSADLHVDHIVPFALIVQTNKLETTYQAQHCAELWNISNGRTLCVECHKTTDTWGHGTKKMLRDVSTRKD